VVAGRRALKNPTFQLRSATRWAKSDVAKKLISMFLHELSRKISFKLNGASGSRVKNTRISCGSASRTAVLTALAAWVNNL